MLRRAELERRLTKLETLVRELRSALDDDPDPTPARMGMLCQESISRIPDWPK